MDKDSVVPAITKPFVDRNAALKYTCLLVGLLVFGILLTAALTSDFRGDDYGHLWEHKFKVMPNPLSILTEAQFSGHYRPMVKVFFGLNYLVFGLHAWGYTVSLVLIFWLTLLVFFYLVQRLANQTPMAYAAVLLFLMQMNVYIYTVNWIAAATNILSGFFVMATLFFYVTSTLANKHREWAYGLALASFGLGLLSRELLPLLLPVLLVYDFLFLWLDAPYKGEVFKKCLLRQAPFWLLFVLYLAVRGLAVGARELSGSEEYSFVLAPHVLNNVLFFAVQLGFILLAVMLCSLPALLFDKVWLTRRELKLVAFGLTLAACTTLPFLFFNWSSPTWLYLPAFGVTLAAATLFQRVWRDGLGKSRTLLWAGLLVCVLAGNIFLFSKLNEARWWQWGEYSRGVLVQVQAYYPTLPPGARLYFIDKNEAQPYGLKRLFRFAMFLTDALQLRYDNPTLTAYFMDEARPSGPASTRFVFEYDQGRLVDKTRTYQEQAVAK